jgi:hypothetical protein
VKNRSDVKKKKNNAGEKKRRDCHHTNAPYTPS